jgi:hypothetical protein
MLEGGNLKHAAAQQFAPTGGPLRGPPLSTDVRATRDMHENGTN